MIETLCTLARETVVPSNSTGSKIATGFKRPVRLGDHSILRNTVSTVSSCHLKANPTSLFGFFSVHGCDSAYSTSLAATTRPSTGNAYLETRSLISLITDSISETSHKTCSVVSKPSDFKNSISP